MELNSGNVIVSLVACAMLGPIMLPVLTGLIRHAWVVARHAMKRRLPDLFRQPPDLAQK